MNYFIIYHQAIEQLVPTIAAILKIRLDCSIDDFVVQYVRQHFGCYFIIRNIQLSRHNSQNIYKYLVEIYATISKEECVGTYILSFEKHPLINAINYITYNK